MSNFTITSDGSHGIVAMVANPKTGKPTCPICNITKLRETVTPGVEYGCTGVTIKVLSYTPTEVTSRPTDVTPKSLYDFSNLIAALESSNPHQSNIAEVGLHVVTTLLRKNADYGSSIFNSPILKPSMSPADAILVRLSDKFNRIAHLSGGEAAKVAESIDDTMLDIAGYAILWLARQS